MYDRPDDFNPDKHNGEINLSASELKKLKKKQKKEKAREALEAAAKQKQQNSKKVKFICYRFRPFPFYASFSQNKKDGKVFRVNSSLTERLDMKSAVFKGMCKRQ